MDDTHYREAICPACGIIDRFGDKWSLRILFLLHQKGTLRFNELLRNTPNVSQKMLATALKKLEADKLVNRKLYPEIPPKVEYSLTSLGKSLMSPLDGIIQWALEHSDEILEHRQKRKNRRKYRTSMFYTLPFYHLAFTYLYEDNKILLSIILELSKYQFEPKVSPMKLIPLPSITGIV